MTNASTLGLYGLAMGDAAVLGVGVRPPGAVGLRAYPNPSAGRVAIGYSGRPRSDASLDVIDASGRRVQQLHRGVVGPDAQFTWDGRYASGSAAPAGLYFVRLTDATGGFETTRIVRVR